MATITTRRPGLGLAGLFLGCALSGCGQTAAPPEKAQDNATPTAAQTGPAASNVPTSPEERLHQSFVQATRAEPPDGSQRPPDQTLTGRPTGQLYTRVVQNWDTIRFTTADGKPLEYRAVLDTELGEIEIALRPDLAPNHVRNFLALAQAGLYEGLVFQRTVRAQPQGDFPELQLIEGGCPLGTGEAGHGSIGYWLRPEFSKEPQEEGTVGACHGTEDDTAACKFYILLSKAPFLDGNYTVFGKVTRGLDVARKVLTQPVRTNDPEYPENDRPEKPVVIRKVTIHADETERTASR